MVALDETSLRLTLSMLTEDVLPVPAVKISYNQLVYSVKKEIVILLPGFGLEDS